MIHPWRTRRAPGRPGESEVKEPERLLTSARPEEELLSPHASQAVLHRALTEYAILRRQPPWTWRPFAGGVAVGVTAVLLLVAQSPRPPARPARSGVATGG